MTIGEIKNNQAVSISQKHRKMCSKLAKNAVYFHFKKIVVNEHYSLLMKSFRVLAGAPKNISNDEVEIEYKIT